MLKNQQRHVVIVGATASGKSDVAISIAKTLQREIISLDSMQIYQGMEVGTGVIPVGERQGVVHHMISFLEPTQTYSVKRFQETVHNLIGHSSDKYVFVGGTGLYTHAVIDNYQFAPTDEKVREGIIQKYELDEKDPDVNKVAAAYEILSERDPLAASKIEPMNVRRIVRALESIEMQQKFSEIGKGIQNFGETYFPVSLIGLRFSREILRERIIARVETMLNSGWIEEVQYLLPQWINMTEPARNAIGYPYIVDWIHRGMEQNEYPDLIESIVNRTVQFSRRQRKWFERDQRIEWIDCDDLSSDDIYEAAMNKIL